VIWVELTSVEGIVTPFKATDVFPVKPVPVKVTALAVLIAPPEGLMPVRVGAGGLVMVTVAAFEREGLAAGVVTVMLAVPVAVRSEAGTVAMSS